MKTAGKSSLSQPVYEHLTKMLLNMELKPGDRIPENKIAQQFGISRTPIREALRRLANDGVINIYPNRYAEVITIDPEYVSQIGQARIAIDTMLAKLAVYYGNNADFAHLQELAVKCTEATKTNDHALRSQADNDFHAAFSQLSRNPILIEAQKSLSFRVNLLIAWKYIRYDDGYSLSLDHHELVDALSERNESRAVKVAVQHLVKFYSLDESFPPYFFFPK